MAQPFSYVYIQGDRETPFYVKLEDQMQPRYGKDYCIVSQLAAGAINVQILFQQNAYPPQKFTILVPDNGYRGFLLTRKGTSFSLYDLQQQFYLPAGNSQADDHAPVNNPDNNYVATTKTITPVTAINNTDAVITEKLIPPASKTSIHKKTKTPPASNQPQFIENLELTNERTAQQPPVEPADTVVTTQANTNQVNTPVNPDDLENNMSANTKPSIANSDCPAPMHRDEFESLYKKVNGKSDKSRLKYLLSKMDNCYTTMQVRILTKTLSNDPERYAFLKQAYSRVTDQVNFSSLENLLSTQEWKSYFRLIAPN